jgi:hypothetical protein
VTLVALLLGLLFQVPGETVEGIVVDDVTGAPVVNARILLARADGPLADSIVGSADEQSRFAIRNVPPGRYRVFAEPADYVRREAAQRIVVGRGKPIERISIALTPTGVITGRVLNEAGYPAPKTYVWATRAGGVAETLTNDLGEYRFFGLMPGRYMISAERPGARLDRDRYQSGLGPHPNGLGAVTVTQSVANLAKSGDFVGPRALTGETYPEVFCPGTTDRASARPLDLRPGAHISGIDLQLVVVKPAVSR